MTDKDYTLIHIVADRTGSMGQEADGSFTRAQRSTEGIHNLVREQRKLPGKTEFSLLAFDSDGMDSLGPGDGEDILGWRCQPRSGTPLLDAIGSSMVQVGERLDTMTDDERPGRVIFVIATDGEENMSREYTKKQVGEMIATQRDVYKWDFVFIGTEFDAFGEAGSVGIAHANTMSTAGSSYAVGWNVTNDAITRNRIAGTAVAYAAADYKAVEDAETETDTKTKQIWVATGRSDRSKPNG